jgi:hypothetical protein
MNLELKQLLSNRLGKRNGEEERNRIEKRSKIEE